LEPEAVDVVFGVEAGPDVALETEGPAGIEGKKRDVEGRRIKR